MIKYYLGVVVGLISMIFLIAASRTDSFWDRLPFLLIFIGLIYGGSYVANAVKEKS